MLLFALTACNYADFLPEPTPTQEINPPARFICAVVIANDVLNLRATPDSTRTDNIIFQLERGRNVWVAENQQNVNGWAWVDVPGTVYQGFAWAALLKMEPGKVC